MTTPRFYSPFQVASAMLSRLRAMSIFWRHRTRLRRVLAVSGLSLASLVLACSVTDDVNPQPIPPKSGGGEGEDGAKGGSTSGPGFASDAGAVDRDATDAHADGDGGSDSSDGSGD